MCVHACVCVRACVCASVRVGVFVCVCRERERECSIHVSMYIAPIGRTGVHLYGWIHCSQYR